MIHGLVDLLRIWDGCRGAEGLETRRACRENRSGVLTRCVRPPDILCCSEFEWWVWRRRRRSTPCQNRPCRRPSSRPERCSSLRRSAFYKSQSNVESKTRGYRITACKGKQKYTVGHKHDSVWRSQSHVTGAYNGFFEISRSYRIWFYKHQGNQFKYP